MAEELTFDFGNAADNQVDTRVSPMESQGGDPIKKGASGNPFGAAFNASIDNAFQDIYATPYQSPLQKALAPSGPNSMGFAPESLTDQYMYQEGFDARYFNPFDPTNYQKFADKETWGSALGKGFDSFGYKFGNTFTDYWKGYGRMAEALFTLDWDKMRPDEATMMEQYYKDQIDMKKNFVFEQPENEDSIFSKRTMSEFIGNSGFALGTFAGLGLEIAADVAITVLSGGAGAVSFGATASRVGVKEGLMSSAKVFGRDVVEGFAKLGTKSVDDLRVLNKINEAETIASAGAAPLRTSIAQTFETLNYSWFKTLKSKSIAEFGENFVKGTPLVGTAVRYGERVAAAAKGGASVGQLTGLTLQGLRRVGQEMNMAATEASFEAVTSYGDTLDKMVQQYKVENNGAVPTAQEFEKMRSLAMDASSSNFNTNMAILLATNKLQFGTLFNKFLPANMIASESAEQMLRVEAKVAGKTMLKAYEKGFAGTYGLLNQVAKDFGKKQAVYQFGKAFAKDALAFEVVEGLQENLQETTASGWRDYYAGQMNGTKYTLSEAFGKGAEEQFTKQGLKTFLMGALTGSIIRLPTAIASRSLDAANKKAIAYQYRNDPSANPIAKAEKQFREDLKVQNDLYKQAYEGKFEQKVFNFNAQMNAAQQTAEAAATGARYEFENGKENALLAAVASAKRTHSIDMLYKAVKEMGVDMTAEDFEKSFGYKIEDTQYNTPQEFSEAVAKDIKKYSETIDNIRSHVKNNLANPYAYADNSRGRIVTSYTRQAQEDAIQLIALNHVKGEMAAERAKQVANDILAMPGMSTSADYALRTLTNNKVLNTDSAFVESELKNLENNIKAEGIDDATKASLQEQIDLKKEELKLLDVWKGFWETRKNITVIDDEGATASEDDIVMFVGKKTKGKVEQTDENGNVTLSEEQDIYSIDDEEVLSTFRKLMEIRNKQAGSDAQISEQTLRDSFKRVYDYMRLDTDVADYMRSVDQLLNPENYQRAVARMLDGKFKYKLQAHLISVSMRVEIESNYRLLKAQEDFGIIFNQEEKDKALDEFRETILNDESYKNILTLVSNKDAGIENVQYSEKLIDDLAKVIDLELTKLVEKVTGVKEEVVEETTTQETQEPAETPPVGPGTEGLGNAPINAGDQDEEVIQEQPTEMPEQVDVIETEVDTFRPEETPTEQPSTTQPSGALENEFGTLTDTGEINNINILLGKPTQDEPFVVTGTPETGFDVIDKNNNKVTEEKLDTQEQAQEISDSLNNTRSNLDFITDLFGKDLESLENASEMLVKITERAVDSLNRYNSKNKQNIENLQEFNMIPKGKQAINRIKKSVMTNMPLEVVADKPVIIEPTGAEQLQLFETTTTPATSASLTLESLQLLHDQIQQALKPQVAEVQEVSTFANNMFPEVAPLLNGKAFGKVDAPLTRGRIIEKNGITYAEYINDQTGSVDIYFAAQNESEYLGYMRMYEDGKPTERFTSKLESAGNNKTVIKEMITNLQSMLPIYHEYAEDISVSTDGLRWFVNQLKNGYELRRDENNEIVTSTVSINGAALSNEFGFALDEETKFENLALRTTDEFNKAKEVIEEYLKQMGVTEPIVIWSSVGRVMTARFNLPVLVKKPGAISSPEMQQVSEKSSKFVEGGIVTEESILDELRKITECFS
jgi:hypothetical protein